MLKSWRKILGVPKKIVFWHFQHYQEYLQNGCFFTVVISDETPSLSKFWRYLVDVKIVEIRHLIGHISYINQNMKNIFCKKKHHNVVAQCKCTKFSALYMVILNFLCIFSLLLWNNFFGTPNNKTNYSSKWTITILLINNTDVWKELWLKTSLLQKL